MDALTWERRPEIRRPVMIAAFEGWNDAGDAASSAARHLAASMGATRFASIDPEEFYDFTATRPTVRLDQEMNRRIDWPRNEFLHGNAGGRDVVFLQAVEPHLKWRTYAGGVVDVARELDVELVVTFGALLADVPHTRPVRVMGTASSPEVQAKLGFRRSRYEGPTGIVSVVQDALATAGIKSASLWASTPYYLPQTPCPKAALALVERASSLFSIPVATRELEIASAAYERQVNELVEAEDEVADYVRQLEAAIEDDDRDSESEDFDVPAADTIAAEVERYLRDQRGDA